MEQGKPEKSVLIKEIPPITKEWSKKELDVLTNEMRSLQAFKKANSEKPSKEQAEGVLEIQERSIKLYESMKSLFTDYGAEFKEDANEIYQKYSSISDPLVCRREDPVKVVELVSGEPISFKFDPEVVFDRGDKYANCALWPHGPVNNTTGIKNAFLEGRGDTGLIVTMTAFRNNPEHMTITEPEDKMESVGTLSRQSVRIVSGTASPEDLEFIIVRVPALYFPHDQMTEWEQKQMEIGKLPQVFRGFKFTK